MLEYLPKDKIREGIGGLKKRLNKDGTFLTFITKDNIYMRFLIGKWWKSNVYEKEEFKSVFSDLGFKNINYKEFSAPYKYLNSWGIIVEARKN